MKSQLSISVFLMTAIAQMGFVAPANAEPPSYQLKCVSGGNMVANFNALMAGRTPHVRVFLQFDKATSAPTSMRPGQCTWLDRRINSGEPNRIRVAFRSNFAVNCDGLRCTASGGTSEPLGVLMEVMKGGRPGNPTVFDLMVYNAKADNRQDIPIGAGISQRNDGNFFVVTAVRVPSQDRFVRVPGR